MIKLSDYQPFRHASGQNLDVPISEALICEINETTLLAGRYSIAFNCIWSLDDIGNFAYLIFNSTTGVFSRTEFQREPKDRENILDFSYAFIVDHPVTGAFNAQFLARKENVNDNMSITASNIILNKVADYV